MGSSLSSLPMDTETAIDCYHCGEPVPGNSSFVVTIEGSERTMCCPGCQAVAQLIAGSGLDSFYRLRTGFSQRPEAQDSAASYAVYDLVDNQFDFVEYLDNGNRRARLLLGGVNCAACTWLIETALLRHPAIDLCNVNLSQQTLTVEWDPSGLALSQLFLELQELGYEPHPWQARKGAELIQQEQRRSLRELAVAGLAMMQVGMFAIALHAGDLQGIELEYRSLLRWVSLIIASVVVFYSASSFFRNAWNNLKQMRLVMDVPVALAIGLAYSASAYATVANQGQVYFDSVAMFTFFLLLGRFLERRVRQRELLRQTDLQSLLPATCRRLDSGQWRTVVSREVAAGDILSVDSGCVVPADGIITEGSGSVDEAAFTGENLPRPVSAGDPLTAGTLLVDGSARLRADGAIKDSRMAAMLKVMSLAEQQKPGFARLADRVAAWFVAAVLLVASGVAVYWLLHDPQQALWISLSVLVVSCPCALALATPAALTNAVSALRRRGVLLSGDNTLEQLNKCGLALFDKTGTLTIGKLERRAVAVLGDLSESRCLEIAAGLEQHSNHPIASAFSDIDCKVTLEQVKNLPGQGVSGTLDDKQYAIGNSAFATTFNPQLEDPPTTSGHWIALTSRTQTLAWIHLGDQVRPEAATVVSALQSRGFRVELLSGDSSSQAPELALELGMDACHSGCSPQQKLDYIQRRQSEGERVVMVGDGLNDAPVLAAADCSFAVNNATDLAKSRADAIVLKQDLFALVQTLEMARRCRHIIIQNMIWALGYNSLALPLAAAGMIPPWAAAIGMSLSSLLVVGNSMRLN
jgi:Cu2+-exporting ATPase